MRKTAWTLGLALILAIGPSFAGHGQRNVVVSGHGEGSGDFVFADDAERFDLSELEDGETRYFGSGAHEVKATREGDRVKLSFGDERRTELSCSVEEEDCSVITTGDEGHVIVMKSSEGPHELHEVMVMRTSADEENVFFSDEQMSVIAVDREGPLHWVGADSGEGHAVIEIRTVGGAALRCPEGDTTMRLEEGEEDAGPFYCPKHDLELELVKPRVHPAHEGVRILVDRDDD